jgi:hypothetical protein
MTTRILIGLACFLHLECAEGFTSGSSIRFFGSRFASGAESITKLQSSENFYNDFDDESIDAGNDDDDEEDDDDFIDTDQLGDWRTFRMNLAETGSPTDKKPKDAPRKSVSRENEEVLRSQSKFLADEYEKGMWAHDTATVR